MDKKAVLWPVIISVLIHFTLLAVAGIINLNDKVKPLDVLSVSIKDLDVEKKAAPKKENKTKEKIKPAQTQKEKGIAFDKDGWREETIDLGSHDIKYVNYLTKVKTKIMRIWQYPPKAFEKNEEGDVIVKMSIDADGRLAAVTLLSSSGYTELDDGAMGVVQKAAPFESLPDFYNLSRLNIIASFEYKIMD
ncbi:MAG: TonB family protein [Smithella sp.]|jgi:TonB family protein